MRRLILMLIAMASVACANAARAQNPGEVTLEKIKADEVEKMITGHKGRVVCVDVWADFCAPCKKKFPHLVQLHKDFAKEGLDCISVSVDLEENFDGALTFLKAQKATFPNFILWDSDENKDKLDPIENKQKMEPKFAHRCPPIFHVFDRDGKKIKTWEGAIKEDEIDKLIKELLTKKVEPIKSGPQVGDKVPGPFEPFNVTGDNAGEECCLFCKFGVDPSVMIFAKEISEPLSALLKKVDELNVKHKKADLGTCAIFCDKGTKLRPELKTLAAKQGYKEIILASLEEAPKGYAINKDADVTVLIYTGAAVKANYSFRKGELDAKAIEAIAKDVGKIVAEK
jgi:thiol-disulfide isomerase/thioredoxin